WLIEWRHHAADRDALAGLLAITRLDSLTLFRIGSAIHQVSHDDLTAASFFAAALSKANSLSSSREIVRAMIAAKPLLWQVVDSGHWQFVDPLYRLNIDLANRISAADQSLSNDRIHGAIGAAECLSLLGQFGPALAELDGFHAQRLTSDQKASIAWVRGQALFALHRYAAALDQFRIVSGVPTFKYSFDNCRMIVMALARQGDVARANAALDELIRSRRPTPSQIAPLLAAIGMGTSDR
ncbi:MAG TPA: hypothetical protein VL992_19260, partial [Tepidisphaeraceae bacterium]|nr:hypothetical protein [Tepidisphaeraceae bacterium]